MKKLWNMHMTILPIVIGAFGTVTKGLLKGLEDLEVGGRVETIQSTALWRTARILRRVLETWGNLLSLKLQWKTIRYRWCEKLKWVNNDNMWNMEVTLMPIVINVLGTVTKFLKRGWKSWKSEDKSRPSKLQHYWERPEY